MKLLQKIIESDEQSYNPEEFEHILRGGDKHKYRMLSRLQQDMKYYYGNGGESESVLWAKDLDTQLNLMKDIWNSFPEDGKPEWLTYEEIESYDKTITENVYTSNKEYEDLYGDEVMDILKKKSELERINLDYVQQKVVKPKGYVCRKVDGSLLQIAPMFTNDGARKTILVNVLPNNDISYSLYEDTTKVKTTLDAPKEERVTIATNDELVDYINNIVREFL